MASYRSVGLLFAISCYFTACGPAVSTSDGDASTISSLVDARFPGVSDIDDLTTATRVDLVQGDGGETAGYRSPSIYAQFYEPIDTHSLQVVRNELTQRIVAEGWTVIDDSKYWCATPESGQTGSAHVSVVDESVMPGLPPKVVFEISITRGC